tara:strand:+ start:1696 stop:1803 length:108 start_codon:yes stop_codon:yes gene_type:complete
MFTSLGKSGVTIEFESFTVVKMTFKIEVIVDRRVN